MKRVYFAPLRRLLEAVVLIAVLPGLSVAQNGPIVSHVAGNPGGPGVADGQGTAARFNSPSGMWSDGQSLYIADRGNHTIRRMDIATRSVTTITGTPGIAGNLDGPLNSAQFQSPSAVWGDGSKLYVAGGSSVRIVDLARGVLTTVPGLQVREAIGIWGTTDYLYVLEPGFSGFRQPSQPGSILLLHRGT